MTTPAYVAQATASQTTPSLTVSCVDPSTPGCVAFAAWQCDGGGQTCAPPDGTWIQLFNASLVTDGATYFVWYKKVTAGTGGTLTFTSTNTVDAALKVAAWSGADATTPIDVTPPTPTTNDTGIASPAAVSAPSITTVTDGCLIIFIGIADMTSNTPNADAFAAPTGYTTRGAFFDSSGWDCIAMAEKPQVTLGTTSAITGATITRTGSSFGVVGMTIALRPAAGGGGGGDSNIETTTRKMQRGIYPHLWMRPQEEQRVRSYSIGDGRRERAAFDSKLKPVARRSRIDAHL